MSKLGDITKSYGKQFNIAVANTSGDTVLNASGLPANNLIISAPADSEGNDAGSYAMLATDGDGTAVRLSYTIIEGNGLYADGDTLSLHTDPHYFTTTGDGALTVIKENIYDNDTIIDGKVNIASLTRASQKKYGVAAIDGVTIKRDLENKYYVDTNNLQLASDYNVGIATGDMETTSVSKGVISVVTGGLDRAMPGTFGISMPDNNTIVAEDGKYSVITGNLSRSAKDHRGVSMPDNNTIIAVEEGKYKVVTGNLQKASDTRKGVVKLDPMSFAITDGVTSVKEYDTIIDYINKYKNSSEELKKKSTELLAKVRSGEILRPKNKIAHLKCHQTTTALLTKPEYKEEPVNMEKQHVYVSLDVITYCDFHISVDYKNNISPNVEIVQVNYNDEFATDGIKGLDMVYPSTEGVAKQVVLHFVCKNFSSMTEGFSKTTLLTITLSDINNNKNQKKLLYSIVRYNSNINEEEYQKEIDNEITFAESYIGSFWTGNQTPDIQHKFNSTKHIVNWADEYIDIHCVYTDNKGNTYFHEDRMYLDSAYDIYNINQVTDQVILYSINVTDSNNVNHVLVWTLYLMPIPHNIVVIDKSQKELDIYNYNYTYVDIFQRQVNDIGASTFETDEDAESDEGDEGIALLSIEEKYITNSILYVKEEDGKKSENTYNYDSLTCIDIKQNAAVNGNMYYDTFGDDEYSPLQNIFYTYNDNVAYISDETGQLHVVLDKSYNTTSNKFNKNEYSSICLEYVGSAPVTYDMYVLPYSYSLYKDTSEGNAYNMAYVNTISGHYTNVRCHSVDLNISNTMNGGGSQNIAKATYVDADTQTLTLNDIYKYIKYTYSIDKNPASTIPVSVNSLSASTYGPDIQILNNVYVPGLRCNIQDSNINVVTKNNKKLNFKLQTTYISEPTIVYNIILSDTDITFNNVKGKFMGFNSIDLGNNIIVQKSSALNIYNTNNPQIFDTNEYKYLAKIIYTKASVPNYYYVVNTDSEFDSFKQETNKTIYIELVTEANNEDEITNLFKINNYSRYNTSNDKSYLTLIYANDLIKISPNVSDDVIFYNPLRGMRLYIPEEHADEIHYTISAYTYINKDDYDKIGTDNNFTNITMQFTVLDLFQDVNISLDGLNDNTAQYVSGNPFVKSDCSSTKEYNIYVKGIRLQNNETPEENSNIGFYINYCVIYSNSNIQYTDIDWDEQTVETVTSTSTVFGIILPVNDDNGVNTDNIITISSDSIDTTLQNVRVYMRLCVFDQLSFGVLGINNFNSENIAVTSKGKSMTPVPVKLDSGSNLFACNYIEQSNFNITFNGISETLNTFSSDGIIYDVGSVNNHNGNKVIISYNDVSGLSSQNNNDLLIVNAPLTYIQFITVFDNNNLGAPILNGDMPSDLKDMPIITSNGFTVKSKILSEDKPIQKNINSDDSVYIFGDFEIQHNVNFNRIDIQTTVSFTAKYNKSNNYIITTSHQPLKVWPNVDMETQFNTSYDIYLVVDITETNNNPLIQFKYTNNYTDNIDIDNGSSEQGEQHR